MEKTITDLSVDYFKAAADMDSLIKKCTLEIKEETRKGNARKTYFLKQKRLVFYSQKRELMTTAYKLQNYYKRKENELLESA